MTVDNLCALFTESWQPISVKFLKKSIDRLVIIW